MEEEENIEGRMHRGEFCPPAILPIFSLFLSDGTREEEEGGEERELPRGPH